MLVTLDTNVVRDMVESNRNGHQAAAQIAALVRDNVIQAQVTTRVAVDVPDDPLKSLIDGTPELPQVRAGAPFRLDYSTLDSGDYLTAESESHEATALLNLLFPGSDPNNTHHRNRLADVDHLLAHRNSSAEWFLTSEKALLNHAAELRIKYSIKAASPTEFLEQRLWQLRT